ncbi:MAG: hypothetical protein KDC38_00240 [Planctomycetes bacterium]|nr:hypothetical protein [Planctomycetota bacterium]
MNIEWTLLILGLAIIGWTAPGFADGADAKGQEELVRARRVAPLTAAGIDIESLDAVIAALDHEQLGVRVGAVYLLREKRAKSAIPALEKQLTSKPSILQIEVVETLAALGDPLPRWKKVAHELLEDRSAPVALRSAEVLARAKDPAGWSVVERGLKSAESATVAAAARSALAFEGLSTGTGDAKKEIPAFESLTRSFQDADEETQRTLLAAFAGTRSKKAIETLESWVPFARGPINEAQLKNLIHSLSAARAGRERG